MQPRYERLISTIARGVFSMERHGLSFYSSVLMLSGYPGGVEQVRGASQAALPNKKRRCPKGAAPFSWSAACCITRLSPGQKS